MVSLIPGKSIGFLHPDSQNITQFSRIAPCNNQVMLIHNPAEIRRNKRAALFHKLTDLFIRISLCHIKKRCHDYFILLQVILHANDIHRIILFLQRFVIQENLVQIFQVTAWACRVLNCPPVIPVNQNCRLCPASGTQGLISKLLQFLSQLGNFTENSGIFRPNMVNHRTMIFFTCTNGPSHLEKQHRICPMSHSLIAPQTHNPRTLQRIVRQPVGHTWRLLHQHKRLSPFDSPHQVMIHGNSGVRIFICRIIVPGDKIHGFCPHLVIQWLIKSHEICGNLCIRNHRTDCSCLCLIAFQHPF